MPGEPGRSVRRRRSPEPRRERAPLERWSWRSTGPGLLAQPSAHREFHLALVALAGHQHLLRVYEPVLLQLELYWPPTCAGKHSSARRLKGLERHRRLYESCWRPTSGRHSVCERLMV